MIHIWFPGFFAPALPTTTATTTTTTPPPFPRCPIWQAWCQSQLNTNSRTIPRWAVDIHGINSSLALYVLFHQHKTIINDGERTEQRENRFRTFVLVKYEHFQNQQSHSRGRLPNRVTFPITCHDQNIQSQSAWSPFLLTLWSSLGHIWEYVCFDRFSSLWPWNGITCSLGSSSSSSYFAYMTSTV